jgi:hypothetical protein
MDNIPLDKLETALKINKELTDKIKITKDIVYVLEKQKTRLYNLINIYEKSYSSQENDNEIKNQNSNSWDNDSVMDFNDLDLKAMVESISNKKKINNLSNNTIIKPKVDTEGYTKIEHNFKQIASTFDTVVNSYTITKSMLENKNQWGVKDKKYGLHKTTNPNLYIVVKMEENTEPNIKFNANITDFQWIMDPKDPQKVEKAFVSIMDNIDYTDIVYILERIQPPDNNKPFFFSRYIVPEIYKTKRTTTPVITKEEIITTNTFQVLADVQV